LVGARKPAYVIAEIGINHDGSVEVAKQLIGGAVAAGCDAVKFQKRTPERCVPRDQWKVERETPWGRMEYIEYKRRIELGYDDYLEIDRFCEELGVDWFASCWDEESVEFMEQFDPPCYKVASASLTDHALLRAMRQTGRPVILSTGMSTMAEIEAAVAVIGQERLLVAHSTSVYPCEDEDVNLRVLGVLAERFPSCPIGYSGHERGVAPTVAAVALGATFVERHVTLDRGRWGTDHAASLDLEALGILVRQVREVSLALGDGVKRVYERELPYRQKLRRVMSAETPEVCATDREPESACP